jgi:hypothetical protein
LNFFSGETAVLSGSPGRSLDFNQILITLKRRRKKNCTSHCRKTKKAIAPAPHRHIHRNDGKYFPAQKPVCAHNPGFHPGLFIFGPSGAGGSAHAAVRKSNSVVMLIAKTNLLNNSNTVSCELYLLGGWGVLDLFN